VVAEFYPVVVISKTSRKSKATSAPTATKIPRGFEMADNGLEALAQFDQADVALVILDIMLPKMDGLEVCRRIRQKSTVPNYKSWCCIQAKYLPTKRYSGVYGERNTGTRPSISESMLGVCVESWKMISPDPFT
jgi:Response regulator receiver domain